MSIAVVNYYARRTIHIAVASFVSEQVDPATHALCGAIVIGYPDTQFDATCPECVEKHARLVANEGTTFEQQRNAAILLDQWGRENGSQAIIDCADAWEVAEVARAIVRARRNRGITGIDCSHETTDCTHDANGLARC